jgi:hypothetical protein
MLAHSLYFADHSESWGGAIAFIRRTVFRRTHLRAHLAEEFGFGFIHCDT